MYIIKSDEGFWSNEIGWVYDRESATEFNNEEYNQFKNSLPIGDNVRWDKE